MDFERVKSQRGGSMIIYELFIYCYDKKINLSERYRCRKRTCTAVCYLTNDVLSTAGSHNHENHRTEIERIKLNLKIKSRARETNEMPKHIIVQETKNHDTNELNHHIKPEAMKKIITRERNKIVGIEIAGYVDIPMALQKDHQGNNFLIHDSGYDDINRFVIFSSQFKSFFIMNADVWLVDGTFKSVPGDFYQLITVHIFIFGKTYPAYYILLKNKCQEIYNNCFKYIRDIQKVRQPRIVVTDFEIGLHNALQETFVDSTCYFCFFHYSQSLYRRIKEIGYALKYKNDPEFRKIMKKFFSLPFFPLYRLQNAYNIIEEEVTNLKDDKMIEYLNYFRKTYYNNATNGPIYNPRLWSCFDRVINFQPRTTNNVEGWHRAFNQVCLVSHPNIAVVVKTMQDEEELNRIELSQFKSGRITVRAKLEKEEKIRLLLLNEKFIGDDAYFESLDLIFKLKFE